MVNTWNSLELLTLSYSKVAVRELVADGYYSFIPFPTPVIKFCANAEILLGCGYLIEDLIRARTLYKLYMGI